MKKPLASALAVLTVFLSFPASSFSDDPPGNPSPALQQVISTLKGDGWTFDTDKQVLTKDGKTIDVRTLNATPPTTQAPPKAAPKEAGLKTTVPPESQGDSHVISGEKKSGGFLSDLAHNDATWILGGGLAGAALGGLIAGPIGFMVFGIAGLLIGHFAHDKFMGGSDKKK